jgi:hypothetical protein
MKIRNLQACKILGRNLERMRSRGRIILKWIVEKLCENVGWIHLLQVGFSEGLLWT